MAEQMDRRTFVRNATLLGVGAAAGGLGVLAWRSAVPPDASAQAPAPIVHPGTDDPVLLSDLLEEAPLMVSAQYLDGPALVLKVPVETLRAAAEVRGYDTGQYAVRHPDDPDAALLVYDGKCTHLGCTVGWNRALGASLDVPSYDDDGEPDGRLMCPCHQSQFDVHDLATNLSGPAPRPLDVIPIDVVLLGDRSHLVGLRRIRQERPRDADARGAGAAFSL